MRQREQTYTGFGRGQSAGMAHRFRRSIHIVDSTVVQLMASCLDWAKHRRRKAAAKCHLRLHLRSMLPSCVVVLAYCLSITLRQQLRKVAGGLMPRSVFEKLATMQMLDVVVPTTDGRELLLVRRTEPSADVQLLLERLGLTLPPQPPRASAPPRSCSGDLWGGAER